MAMRFLSAMPCSMAHFTPSEISSCILRPHDQWQVCALAANRHGKVAMDGQIVTGAVENRFHLGHLFGVNPTRHLTDRTKLIAARVQQVIVAGRTFADRLE